MVYGTKEENFTMDDDDDNSTRTILHIIIFSVLIVLIITSSMKMCIFNSRNNKLRTIDLEEKEALFDNKK